MSLVVKEKNHVRLVFLGAAGVGKTALIRRFLMDTFEPKHRRTVEELHSKEYEVSGATVKVEILDTSGSYSFPAMRKLSIQNSDAFALVYAVDDAESFESVKSLREEILEVKEDKFPPIVVVGNKAESGGERRVPAEDALSLVELDWNSRFVETSAKDNENVLEVFRELLQQANLPSRLSPALWETAVGQPARCRQAAPRVLGKADEQQVFGCMHQKADAGICAAASHPPVPLSRVSCGSCVTSPQALARTTSWRGYSYNN